MKEKQPNPSQFKNAFQIEQSPLQRYMSQRQNKNAKPSAIQTSGNEVNIFKSKSMLRSLSNGLTETEQINPVTGQDFGNVNGGGLKQQQNGETNGQQAVYMAKNKMNQRGDGMAFQIDDSNSSNKNGIGSQQNNLNTDDQYLFPQQQENRKYSIKSDKNNISDSDIIHAAVQNSKFRYSERKSFDSSDYCYQNQLLDHDPKTQKLSNFQNSPIKYGVQKNELGLIVKHKEQEFDKGYDFEIYFPHNNMKVILAKLIIIWKRNIMHQNNKKLNKQKRAKINLDQINSAISGYKQMQQSQKQNRIRNSDTFSMCKQSDENSNASFTVIEERKSKPSRFISYNNQEMANDSLIENDDT